MPVAVKRAPAPPIQSVTTHIVTGDGTEGGRFIEIDAGDEDSGKQRPATLTVYAVSDAAIGTAATNAGELRQIAEAATIVADELDRRAG